MVALRASRFVCSAIEVMSFSTLPISVDDTASRSTFSLAAAASRTAPEATPAASAALRAISWIDTPISSAPVATVLTCRDTSLDEADASAICALVEVAAPEISALTLDSSREALARPSELLETSEMEVRMLAMASSRQTAI